MIDTKERIRFADDEGIEGEMEDFPIIGDLKYAARKQIELLKTIARGFMLIMGEPGGGKDLFAVSTASLFKHFMGRPIILDFLPNKLFGDYRLLDAPSILNMIRAIAKLYKVEGIEGSQDQTELTQFMEEATVKWLLEGEGYDIFHRAVYYISELKKVAYNRNPNARTNKFIGTLGSVWRHLDMLLMGTHVHANELDVKAFLQYSKLRTSCTQTLRQDIFIAKVYRGMYAGSDFVISNIALKPLVFTINGREPREYLDGHCFYELYRTKRMRF